jgi:hypothetical protein
MSINSSDRKEKNYILRRSLLDYGMGAIILGFGVFFAVADRFGMEFNITPAFRYAFVALCIIYGAFRIYRGYKKNYFSE